MAERKEFHLFSDELEETRVLIVSQSTTYDGTSSFERVSYEVQQFVRPSTKSGDNVETIGKTEFYTEKESFNNSLKCHKVFYKDYQYKRKMLKTPDFEDTEGEGNFPTMKKESSTSKEGTSISSFIKQRKDKKFSYTEWKCNLEKNVADWNFLETNEYDVIYNQTSNDGLGQRILAKTELDRIERDLTELETKVDYLDSTFENLQQNRRRNWLVLHGVFEKDSEDTLEVTMEVVREKTGLQINPQDVQNCHRMGRRRYMSRADATNKRQNPKGVNKRPIVIKFMNYCKRKDLWDHKKYLRGSGLLLTESLTTQRLQLLQTARGQFGEKSVWSQDGRIMYRRPDGSKVRLNNFDDLNAISSDA